MDASKSSRPRMLPQIGQKNLTSMEELCQLWNRCLFSSAALSDVTIAVGTVEHIFDSCYSFSRHFYSYLEKALALLRVDIIN